uniref:Protein odr-4 homolog n=1 Tax=Salmo trutta TaxID=8032 RepID=A0A674DFL4_SALTR
MGRDYIVEGVVVKYMSNLRPSCVTGLLIGRDFVVLAMRTPQKDTEGQGSPSVSRRAGTSLDHLDLDWVTEHARQVSRMLQGGFSVFGIFLVTPPELPKEAQNTLRQLMGKHISKGRIWSLTKEDVTEVTFHICSNWSQLHHLFTSFAKPADWKYQWWGCTSWPMFTCSVKLDLLFPVLEMHVLPQDMEKCVKEELQTWAKQIEDGLCLIYGKTMPDEKNSVKAYFKVFYTTNMNIVSSRVEMFLQDILIEKERTMLVLPRRVFASLPGMGLCVNHLKEMLDKDMPENSIDTSQEALLAPTIDLEDMIFQKNLKAKSTFDASPKTPSEDPTEDPKRYKMTGTDVGRLGLARSRRSNSSQR